MLSTVLTAVSEASLDLTLSCVDTWGRLFGGSGTGGATTAPDTDGTSGVGVAKVTGIVALSLAGLDAFPLKAARGSISAQRTYFFTTNNL